MEAESDDLNHRLARKPHDLLMSGDVANPETRLAMQDNLDGIDTITGRSALYIDAAMGLAGDMFVAALRGLGLPQQDLQRLMQHAAEPLGGAKVEFGTKYVDGEEAHSISVFLTGAPHSLSLTSARKGLHKALTSGGVVGPYAAFARRALSILADAEERAHRGFELGGAHTSSASGENHTEAIGPGLEPGSEAIMDAHHQEIHLHEAQDIIMDVAGAAWGLQRLDVDLDVVFCLRPVRAGRGEIRCSHGVLGVPAPATAAILEEYEIPWTSGPMDFEQLTPTGAAILAALSPEFIDKTRWPQSFGRIGIGLGAKVTSPPNALRVLLTEKPHSEG